MLDDASRLRLGCLIERDTFASNVVTAGLMLLYGYAQLAVGMFAAYVATHGESYATLDALCRWDCGWYSSIVTDGYSYAPSGHGYADAANWAFWPLFPLLVGTLGSWLSLSFAHAGLLLNVIALFALNLTVLQFGSAMFEARRHRVGFLLLFVSSPFYFYLQIPYGEAVFSLLLVVSFLSWSGGYLATAGISGVLMTATRPHGLFWAVSLALAVLINVRFNTHRAVVDHYARALTIALMPLGALAYLVYLWDLTGDILAYPHVLRAWGRVAGLSILQFFDDDLGMIALRAYWLLGGAAALPLVVWLLRRERFRAIGIFALMTFAISVLSKIESLPRYMWTMPLLYVPLYEVCRSRARIAPIYAFAALLFLMKLFLIYAWNDGQKWVI